MYMYIMGGSELVWRSHIDVVYYNEKSKVQKTRLKNIHRKRVYHNDSIWYLIEIGMFHWGRTIFKDELSQFCQAKNTIRVDGFCTSEGWPSRYLLVQSQYRKHSFVWNIFKGNINDVIVFVLVSFLLWTYFSYCSDIFIVDKWMPAGENNSGKRVSVLQKLLGRFYRSSPAGIYLLKINNKDTRTRCKICSKLTVKTPEWLLFLNRSISVSFWMIFFLQYCTIWWFSLGGGRSSDKTYTYLREGIVILLMGEDGESHREKWKNLLIKSIKS